jgi:hypothetical protein
MGKLKKTNLLSIVSFISGLIALLSIGGIFAFYHFMDPAGSILFVTDGILMPIRNMSVVVALFTGILALRDLHKKGHTEKGKMLAWVGILMGAAWLLIGMFVGLVFVLSRIMQ